VLSPWFDYALGGLALVTFLLALILPTRIPAVAFGALTAGAVGLLWYAGRLAAGATIRLRWEYVALGAIILLAGGLRFLGLRQSLPYLDSPDEPTLTRAAIKMLQTGDMNPHFFRWPSLPFYLQFIVSLPQFVSDAGKGIYTNVNAIVPEGYYMAGRIYSALVGVGTVILTYLSGRILYGAGVGLLGALILAILPLHSEHSRYITPDGTVTFFATLTLLFAVCLYKTGQPRWYLWAGVAAGLTLGSKYNVAIVFVTIILAHLLGQKRQPGSWRWLAYSFGAMTAAFLVTTPFAIADLAGFLNEMAFQIRHYTILGHDSASQLPAWQAYGRFFWTEAFTYQASLFLVGAIVFALIRQQREDWLLVTFPLMGYFFFSAAKVYFSRNLLPLLPPLAILSAVFLIALVGWLVKKLNWQSKPAWTLAAGALIFSGIFYFAVLHSVETGLYYSRPDTRQQAATWIMAELPAGKNLRIEPNGPVLPTNRFKSANEQRPIGGRTPDWYIEQGFDYLVAVSSQYNELSATVPEAARNYTLIAERFPLVAEFKGESNRYPGPTIKIYKVIK
jgi:4-amino-4-deoxy-L-arabinose transferase-like glycosyltransferase